MQIRALGGPVSTLPGEQESRPLSIYSSLARVAHLLPPPRVCGVTPCVSLSCRMQEGTLRGGRDRRGTITRILAHRSSSSCRRRRGDYSNRSLCKGFHTQPCSLYKRPAPFSHPNKMDAGILLFLLAAALIVGFFFGWKIRGEKIKYHRNQRDYHRVQALAAHELMEQ